MLEWALKYAKNGWSILPTKPRAKAPIMSTWKQYEKQRADNEMLKTWFMQLQNVGIGLVTGKISNVIVLDVESWCPTPIETILEQYPTGLVSKSGRGGHHLYYQYPNGRGTISNRVGIFGGADLRADGGFIVLPPTLHESGNRYEWVEYGIPGKFPDALLRIESQSTGTDKWISDMLNGVTEGGRNDAAARLAGYFFKKGINTDIIEKLLLEWNEKNDPPLPEQEIFTTIRSTQRYHQRNAAGITSVEFIDDRNETPVGTETQPGFELVKFKDYIINYGGDGVSWAVEDWLPDKSIIFLISPPESYKTWLLLDMAISVAGGIPFLGSFKTLRSGPTMIIQQEDAHAGIAERMSVIVQSKFGILPHVGEGNDESTIPHIPELPIHIHPARQLRFTDKKVVAELEKKIEEIRPVVVLIDPLYSATSVDNYMAASAEQMMVLKTWRDRYGCSFLIAHHSKKNIDPESTAREDSWGSQFLNAFQEGGWQIRRNNRLAQNEVVVRRHSKVLGNLKPISLQFDISTKYPMKYQVAVGEWTPSTQATENMTSSQRELYEEIRGNPASVTDVAKNQGKQVSTISRHMKQLETANLVEKMPDGRWKTKSLAEMEE